MCFSAPASFIASGGLGLLGILSLYRAKKKDMLIAAIPFFFAMQQAFEGVQWLYIGRGEVSLWAGYGFLFFAFVVWPLYVPIAMCVLDKKRRGVLFGFLILGGIVALYFLIRIPAHPLLIQQVQSSMSYSFYFPFGSWINILYMTAVFVPLLISSKLILRWYGVVIAFLAIIAWVFFRVPFISVWCFFAAVVSLMFFVYIQLKDAK